MMDLQSNERALLTTTKSKQQCSRINVNLTCGVCGLPAKHYHYGAPACETCKVFFRRAVIKDTYNSFICGEGGHCTVSHVTRRKCSACRFAKCLQIGMNPRWVMNPLDRQKRRECQAIKRAHRMDHMYDPEPRNLLELLSEDEMTAICSLVLHFKYIASQVSLQTVTQQIRNTVDTRGHDVSLFALSLLFGTRVIRFANDLPEFSKLQPTNRNLLIENAMKQMSFLRSAYELDYRRNSWPNDKSYDQYPVIQNDIGRLSAASFRKNDAFAENVHKLGLDEPCVLLLLLVALFSTDNIPELTERSDMEALQERFLSILCKYVRWRYGSMNSTVVFSKILGLCTETQELCVMLSEKDYWMENFEYEYLQKHTMGSMNPYCEYSLQRRNDLFVPVTVDPLGVLEDSIPTVDMIRSIVQDEQSHSKFFQDGSNNSSDLFSLIEELSDLQSPDEYNLDSNWDVGSSGQELCPWSPGEFDLSLCTSAIPL